MKLETNSCIPRLDRINMAHTAALNSLTRNTVQLSVKTAGLASHADTCSIGFDEDMSSFGQFFLHPNRLVDRLGYNDFTRASQERDLNETFSETRDDHDKREIQDQGAVRAERRRDEETPVEEHKDYSVETLTREDVKSEEEEVRAEVQETTDVDKQKETKAEDDRSSETFVAVIAQSILSVPSKRMTLSSIYSYIANHYPHFDKEKGPGWRNSVRHNLSSNDCFVKASRAENGKGHYWMIHPKDLPEFSKGNFRRRRKPRRPKCSHSLMFRESAFFFHAAYPPAYSTLQYPHLRPHQDIAADVSPLPLPPHCAAERSLAQVFRPRLGLISPTFDVPHSIGAVRHHRTPLSFPTSAVRLGETAASTRTYPNFTGSFHYPCACHR